MKREAFGWDLTLEQRGWQSHQQSLPGKMGGHDEGPEAHNFTHREGCRGANTAEAQAARRGEEQTAEAGAPWAAGPLLSVPRQVLLWPHSHLPKSTLAAGCG